ncbi:MAG: chemotaxis protein CheD [Halopseudomonas sp.]
MIILNPGDFYFGNCRSQLKTLLGSCVAITAWHPKLRIGGMCHFLLPSSTDKSMTPLNGRYADDAIELFMAELQRTQTQPKEYQVKLFGGGIMFPQLAKNGAMAIGSRNIQAARWLLKQKGFKIDSEHVGEEGHRSIILDLDTGATLLRWQKPDQQLPNAFNMQP